MSDKTRKILEYISIGCVVLGVLMWLPNFIFQYGYGLWLYTIPVGIAGFILSVIVKKPGLAVLNFLVATSFFWLVWIGYALNRPSEPESAPSNSVETEIPSP